jgi:sec-independent protein translocase protein TatA
MFGSLGVPELVIILVIVVILFGVNKLPRLGRGLGEGIKNFKDSIRPKESGDADSNEDSEKEVTAPR